MSSTGDTSSIYQRPAELLQRLIRFDTTNPPGNESECIAYINELLTEAGIKTTILARAPERPNLITGSEHCGAAKRKFSERIRKGFFELNSDRLFSGHHLDGAFNRVVETGKLCDSHHGQNFLVMTRSTGNTDYLVILLGLGQDLDQDRNSPAVDVSIGVDFQQDLAGPLIVDILVGLSQEWL